MGVKNDMNLEGLELIHSYMEDRGYQSTLYKKDSESTLDVVSSNISKEDDEIETMLNFTYIPIGPEVPIYKIDMLQFYSPIPCEFDLDNGMDLAAVLIAINNRLPFGDFGINEDNEIYYRYVLTVSRNKTINREEFEEVVLVFMDMIDLFSSIIAQVANGTKDMVTAMEEINQPS